MNKKRKALEMVLAVGHTSTESPTYKIIKEALAEPEHDQCRKCNAYKTLTASLESELSWHRKKASEYQQAIATLDSERKANEMLSNEILRLSARKPLTDEQIDELDLPPNGCTMRELVRAIERAHGIKGEK